MHRRIAIALRCALLCAVVALLPGVASTKKASHAAGHTYTVVMQAIEFKPPTLTVHVGDTIVWKNKDLVVHSATAPGLFDSRAIAPGGSWKYKAVAKGNVPYVCTYHPSMRGALIIK